MSAEYLFPQIEETPLQHEHESHLHVVPETDLPEESLSQRAMASSKPNAVYEEAQAIYLMDRVVYSMTEIMAPHTRARAEMAYLAISAFIDKKRVKTSR